MLVGVKVGYFISMFEIDVKKCLEEIKLQLVLTFIFVLQEKYGMNKNMLIWCKRMRYVIFKCVEICSQWG